MEDANKCAITHLVDTCARVDRALNENQTILMGAKVNVLFKKLNTVLIKSRLKM